ncbi:MAG: DUF5916 domain-containing protein [Gemmatimonadaceae bacterium]
MRIAGRISITIPFLLLHLLPRNAVGAQDEREAQTHPVGRDSGTLPGVMAAQRDGSIELDGRLDETAWDEADIAGEFVQGQPLEGIPAQHATTVRVLFDDDALYVGAVMQDDEPAGIARQLVRRDERGQFDYFEVSLDPDRDRRTGYQFRISAAGVQGDAYLFDDVREDESWNAVWASAVQVHDSGWTAELRIPLSQVRFEPSDAAQTWGVNFARRRVASNEYSYFALESRRRHGRVSVFGELGGLRLAGGARRLELRPYVLARALTARAEPGDPFFDGSEMHRSMGLDVRYGIGSAFALDLAINPDFGQVEVDPAEINLSAFESFFPERRPFFVEDARVFDFSLSGRESRLFYSRRIGREPHRLDLDDADFSDAPAQSTILGAAKLTGRTTSGLSIGALAAVTAEEDARAFFAGSESTSSDSLATFIAEPRTGFGVLRARQDLFDGGSQFGAILTGLHRDTPEDGSFDFLPGSAVSGGIDFEHSWNDRAWALWGFMAGTRVSGSSQAITRIQRSSNHYFQRPDALGLDVDSSATSIAGAEWRLQLERRSGLHWTGALWVAERTPGFDPNDFGFVRGGERLDGGARVSYSEIEPGSVLRDYAISAFTFHNWRHAALDDPFAAGSWQRAHKAGSINVDAEVTLLNYWSAELGTRYEFEVLSDVMTRGGPLMIEPASVGFSANVRTDSRRWLSLEPSFRLNRRLTGGGASWDVGLGISARPAAGVEVEIEPSWENEHDPAQYVTRTDDVGYAPTYGPRYIFADLEQQSFELETRLNVAFSPTLTLQLFAQPLLSSGDYVTYKQLARAESFAFDDLEEGVSMTPTTCIGGQICRRGEMQEVDFDGDGNTDFTFEDEDFRVRSLRGNAVLRWEYRPGSTIFLVWQQSRDHEDGLANEFDLGDEAGALFRTAPRNIFILKVNYWFGL